MESKQVDQRQGILLITSGVIVGLLYQLLPIIIKTIGLQDSSELVLTILGSMFNAVLMGILLCLILKKEVVAWFRHFSFKWVLIGLPSLFIISYLSGTISTIIVGKMIPNSINDSLTWGYVLRSLPIMLLGEELLSISILYGAWKKLNWQFWQATLLCGVLFALWHLSAYNFNLFQCLITILPSRLVLNYLFKKTDSIWVTLLVHIAFDVTIFLPILLK